MLNHLIDTQQKAVPPVPPRKIATEPLQPAQRLKVPPVPSVPSEKTKIKTKSLKASDREKLLAYLAAIGETDQEMIDEFLNECAIDTDKLAWALQHADKVLAQTSAATSAKLIQ